jgi:hypothetical protein
MYDATAGGRQSQTDCRAGRVLNMVVPVHEVQRFMLQAMVAVGTVRQHAQQLADVLVAADYRGHCSHGLNRLGEWRSLRAFRDSYLGHSATST